MSAKYNGFDVSDEFSDRVANQKTYGAFRTIYVLLGGTGMKIGLRLRKRVLEAHGRSCLPFQQYIWLDTDGRDQIAQTIQDSKVMEERLRFQPEDLVDLRLPYERVSLFRDNPQQGDWLWKWLDREFLKELGHHANAIEGAAQIRSLGRLAFENRFDEFRQRFETKGGRLREPRVSERSRAFGFDLDENALEVVILCSLAGGTGAGCFIQAGRTIQDLTQNWGLTLNLTGYFLLPEVFRSRLRGEAYEIAQANAYAALAELNALTASSQTDPEPLEIGTYRAEMARTNPFNQIYLVDGQNDRSMTFGEPSDDDAYDMVADALLLDVEPSEFGTRKRSHRCNMSPHLSNFQLLSTPVDDGGNQSRRYSFRFPRAFGAFGLARVPFDRRRYRRAAGARLARDMFDLLLGERPDAMNNVNLDRLVVTPKIEEFGLKPEQLVEELLRRGGAAGQAFLFHDQLAELRVFFKDQRASVEAHFAAEDQSETERLRRIRRADAFGRDLAERVGEHYRVVLAEVDRRLSQEGAQEHWGDHGKHLDDARDGVLDRSRNRIRRLIVDLVSKPLQYGLQVTERALKLMAESFAAAPESPSVERPEPPDVRLSASRRVEQALELTEAAEALWLPAYKAVARRHCRDQHKRVLEQASESLVRKLLDELLGESERRLDEWVQGRYRRAAAERCVAILDELVHLVGDSTQVRDDRGQVTVSTTGLQRELGQLREAAEQSRKWFDGLEESYRLSFHSGRHAKDRTPWDRLAENLEKYLSGNRANRPKREELLFEAWERFLVEKKLLEAGDGSPTVLGFTRLLEWAVERQRDRANWATMQEHLEDWAVKRMEDTGDPAKRGLLPEAEALSLLSGGTDEQIAALDQAGKGANPWLRFRHDVAHLGYLQPFAALGVQNKEGLAVSRWCGQQTEALSHAQAFTSDGGAAVIYAEKMAFPLYVVAALGPLRSAYETMKKRGPFEIAKRHTERRYLELPHLQPARTPEEAGEWFKIDRLALEAALLGIFPKDREYTVRYTVADRANGLRRNVCLPDALEAVANRLRDEAMVADEVREDVSKRRTTLLREPEQARRLLALVAWTQNIAFPDPGPRTSLLEHELAASLALLWSEHAERLLREERRALMERAMSDEDLVPQWTVDCTLRSRQVARGVGGLRMLPPDPARTSTPPSRDVLFG